MKWYGKEHLDPKKTKALVTSWQAPPGNCAAHYYDLFPHLYPKHLPDDHYLVKYNEDLYPTNRDYSTFKPAPAEIKSAHRIEWEDGYGPCNICPVCIRAKELNDQRQADYYRRLSAWKERGTPM